MFASPHNLRPHLRVRVDPPEELHPSHEISSSGELKAPKVQIFAVDGAQRSANEDDSPASVFTASESPVSEFCTIPTVSDLGLSQYAPRQVLEYSFRCFQQSSTESPRHILPTEYQQPFAESPREILPAHYYNLPKADEAPIVGTQFSTENESVREDPKKFAESLDADLQADYSTEKVAKRLWKAMKSTVYNEKDECFLTHEDLFTFVNELAIKTIMAETFGQGGSKERISQICRERHELSRRMILAILIMIKKVDSIDDFINNHIYDKHLPLTRVRIGGERLFQTREPGNRKPQTRNCFEHWEIETLDRFCKTQYIVLTPFLHVSNHKVYYYKMSRNIILPFVEWDAKQQGGHGEIYRVKIHRAHHGFNSSSDSEANPPFAVKSVFTRSFEKFSREVQALQHFSGTSTGHPHLIRLLMAFTHGDNQYLVFPWASGNLIDLWKEEPLPQRSTDKIQWLINQCSGIAGGLAKLHHNRSWDHYQDGKQFQLGRHGDIKPHNILWFENFEGLTQQVHENHLVVSDFGLSIFHSDPCYTELTTANNQSYDIWSLACLYLEFISWYLLGFEKTRIRTGGADPATFLDWRVAGDDSHDDKFFILHRPDAKGGSYGAVVKPEVKEWILRLRALEYCPQALLDFLDLIQHEMLLPIASTRASMARVNRQLRTIKTQSDSSPSYCNRQGESVFKQTAVNNEDLPAIGNLRRSTTANLNVREANAENPLEVPAQPEELDGIISAQLKACKPGQKELRDDEVNEIPNTPLLPIISTPSPQHQDFAPYPYPRRSQTTHKIPSLISDGATVTSDEHQASTPGDSVNVADTPFTTQSSYYEEANAEEQDGHVGAATKFRKTSSATGSFSSMPASPDTRRPSHTSIVPSQEPITEEPATGGADSVGAVDVGDHSSPDNTAKMGKRERYKHRTRQILIRIWDKIVKHVDRKLLGSRGDYCK
ncbi:kinase-like protein [Apiospora arundinis]